ncbi:unnamed protein product, partial [Gulo gulo]
MKIWLWAKQEIGIKEKGYGKCISKVMCNERQDWKV